MENQILVFLSDFIVIFFNLKKKFKLIFFKLEETHIYIYIYICSQKNKNFMIV